VAVAVAVETRVGAGDDVVGLLAELGVLGPEVQAGGQHGLGEHLVEHLLAGPGAEAEVEGAVGLDLGLQAVGGGAEFGGGGLQGRPAGEEPGGLGEQSVGGELVRRHRSPVRRAIGPAAYPSGTAAGRIELPYTNEVHSGFGVSNRKVEFFLGGNGGREKVGGRGLRLSAAAIRLCAAGARFYRIMNDQLSSGRRLIEL
jgi:hypothetical protein